MPTIQTSSNDVTVIVTVDASAAVMPELESHARMGIELFAKFPGYVGGALHVSADGSRLVQYLQWSSEDAYRACVDHPSWNDLPSTRRFFEAVNNGDAVLDARIFRVVAALDAVDR